MGTVVRDWRLANPARRRGRGVGPRSNLATAPSLGHELRFRRGDVASHQRALVRIATVVLPLAAFVLWVWWLGAERRAVRALPPTERAAVFDETMRGFKDLCTPPRNGLEKHCRRQASFLMNFPECDEQCLTLTRPLLQWRS
jgi:hypothetical protein